MTHIEELQGRDPQAARRGRPRTWKAFPLKKSFKGKTVWDGIVEVFHLNGHPQTESRLCVDSRYGRSVASLNGT